MPNVDAPSPLRTRAALVTVAALLVSFTLIGVGSAAAWIGRPFAGFLVLGNGVVASVGLPGWPATRDGEIFQHTLVSVQGESIRGPEDLSGWTRTQPEGATLRYRLVRAGHAIERDIAIRQFEVRDAALLFGAYLLNGLLLGALSLYLIGRRELDRGTRTAAPFLACTALWGLSGMDLYGAHVLFRAHALCESLIFATALQTALQFPTPLFGARTRSFVGCGYAAAALLAVYYQATLFQPAGYVTAHLVATSLGGLGLLLLVASLIVRWLRRLRHTSWAALGAVTVGGAIAFLVPVALTLPEGLTGGSSPQNMVAWTVFFFPLSLGYAVRRQESLATLRRPLP